MDCIYTITATLFSACVDTMKKKSQNWSIEVILALGLFMILFVTMVTLLLIQPAGSPLATQTSADTVSRFLFSDGFDSRQSSVIRNNVIDRSRLEELRTQTYDDLKNTLGLDDDFCIIIEDSHGNIRFKHGSGNILVGDTACDDST